MNGNFKTNSRRNFHAFQAKNILTPEALRSVSIASKAYATYLYDFILLQMYKVHKAVHSIEVNGKKFEDLCER